MANKSEIGPNYWLVSPTTEHTPLTFPLAGQWVRSSLGYGRQGWSTEAEGPAAHCAQVTFQASHTTEDHPNPPNNF